MAAPKHPDGLLELRVHFADAAPGLSGVCAGYENHEWRCTQLARHLVEWLPEFALTESECSSIAGYNAVAMIARAAHAVYTSEKYQHRGEIGELLLHVVLRQVFQTVPAVSKYYFKDAANDTVKGFDAVHVVETGNELELWLGETKFYSDIGDAIRDAVKELEKHTQADYLHAEFAAIMNKIDDSWPHAERLRKLLHRNTSLDEVFDTVCIPVLLSYDSPVVNSHDCVDDAYRGEFQTEVQKHWQAFAKQVPTINTRVHLVLFPMKCKVELAEEFDRRLKACQSMS